MAYGEIFKAKSGLLNSRLAREVHSCRGGGRQHERRNIWTRSLISRANQGHNRTFIVEQRQRVVPLKFVFWGPLFIVENSGSNSKRFVFLDRERTNIIKKKKKQFSTQRERNKTNSKKVNKQNKQNEDDE